MLRSNPHAQHHGSYCSCRITPLSSIETKRNQPTYLQQHHDFSEILAGLERGRLECDPKQAWRCSSGRLLPPHAEAVRYTRNRTWLRSTRSNMESQLLSHSTPAFVRDSSSRSRLPRIIPTVRSQPTRVNTSCTHPLIQRCASPPQKIKNRRQATVENAGGRALIACCSLRSEKKKGRRQARARGCTRIIHGRNLKIIDPRIRTMPGRSTSGCHRGAGAFLVQLLPVTRGKRKLLPWPLFSSMLFAATLGEDPTPNALAPPMSLASTGSLTGRDLNGQQARTSGEQG